MTSQRKISGFTLIELMIALGIIGVLVGVAVPSYNNYLTASAESTGQHNAMQLWSFEENYRLETDTYFPGTHTAGDTNSTLMQELHWKPGDKDQYTYTVAAGSDGDIKRTIEITVTCDACSTPIVVGN